MQPVLLQDHVQLELGDLPLQGLPDLVGACGNAAGGHAHHDLDLIGVGELEALLP